MSIFSDMSVFLLFFKHYYSFYNVENYLLENFCCRNKSRGNVTHQLHRQEFKLETPVILWLLLKLRLHCAWRTVFLCSFPPVAVSPQTSGCFYSPWPKGGGLLRSLWISFPQHLCSESPKELESWMSAVIRCRAGREIHCLTASSDGVDSSAPRSLRKSWRISENSTITKVLIERGFS